MKILNRGARIRGLLGGLLATALVVGFAVGMLYVFTSGWAEDLPVTDQRRRPFGAEQPPDDDEAARVPRMALFQDMTAGSGVDFTCRNGEEADHLTLLESLGGGVALLDFDGDGLLDIFLVGGGY